MADVICYCKMTSVLGLDGVASFLRLKDVTNICRCMRYSQTLVGFLSAMAESF